MHKEVLERKYPIHFRPDRVEGKIAPQGSFTVQVHGLLFCMAPNTADRAFQAEIAGDPGREREFNCLSSIWGLKNRVILPQSEPRVRDRT